MGIVKKTQNVPETKGLNLKPKGGLKLKLNRPVNDLAEIRKRMETMQIVIRPLESLYLDPRNTRTHSKAQVQAVVDSMKAFGWTTPILISTKSNNKIIAGHGRYMAAKQLGLKEVPTIDLGNMSEDELRAYNIADNQLASMAGWDQDLLKAELNELQALKKFDINLTGFNLDTMDGFKVKPITENTFDPESEKDDMRATNLENITNTAIAFPREGKYDLPPLRKDMLIDLSKVKGIATWGGPGSESRGNPLWFYNFHSDSQVGLEWEKTILGFYVDDHRFECWWDDPAKYCRDYLEKGIVGCLTPNFSTFVEWAKAERIYQIYRARWIGRYMQEAGLKIIPDLEACPDDLEWVCAGLKGIKTIAIQAHQKYDTQFKVDVLNKVYDYMLAQLKPETIVLYAPPNRLRMFPQLAKASRVILVEPRTITRQRRLRLKEKFGAVVKE